MLAFAALAGMAGAEVVAGAAVGDAGAGAPRVMALEATEERAALEEEAGAGDGVDEETAWALGTATR